MAKHLLITGFEPFGGESINPSWETVKQLPQTLGDWCVHKLQIPVVFGLAADAVWKAAEERKPDVIICVGQAGGRGSITPEQVAINLRNGTDNAGVSHCDSPCVEGGPNAYFTTLPVRAMVEAMQAAEIPASISYSAGTYVCNDTLYTLLQRFADTDTKVGFVHIPYLPQQAKENAPSLPLETMVQALEKAILALD